MKESTLQWINKRMKDNQEFMERMLKNNPVMRNSKHYYSASQENNMLNRIKKMEEDNEA